MLSTQISAFNSKQEYNNAKKTERKLDSNEADNSVDDFTSNISILGVKYIFNKNFGVIRRVVWLVFVLVGIGFLVYHLENRLRYFFSNPYSINIEIRHEGNLAFPTVTICNNNLLVNSSVNADKESKQLTEIVRMAFSGYVNLNASGFQIESANWTAFLYNHRHRVEKMIPYGICLWNGEPCSYRNFTVVPIATSMGFCYQFNAGSQNLTTKISGKNYGLVLLLNAEQYEYMPETIDAGFTILLQRPQDIPMIEEVGFRVTPGKSYYVGVKQKQVINLPPPHGKCGTVKMNEFETYSVANCFSECFNGFVRTHCGCDSLTSVMKTLRPCSGYDYVTCVFRNKTELAAMYAECECPLECYETLFSPSISQANFAKEFTKSMTKTLSLSDDFIRENIVSLHIFYDQMSYERVEQVESYSALALMADVGGALGLILGSTLMTVVEILDFALVASTKRCSRNSM